jgi:sRNA-binding protein
MSERRAGGALRRYVQSFGYLRAMIPDAPRINLASEVSGTVGAEHASQAAARLADRKARLKRQREAQRAQPPRVSGQPAPEPAPAPTGPKRISLGDLRAAAAARKARVAA